MKRRRTQPDRIDRLADIVGKLAETIAALATAQAAQQPKRPHPTAHVDYVNRPGRLALFTPERLVALLGDKEFTYTEWQAAAVTKLGMSRRSFERLSSIARVAGLVEVRREYHSFYRAT